MPARNELVIRASAVGIDPTLYPNDSKLEQKVLYLEKFGTTYTETLGTGVLTSDATDYSAGDTLTIGNRTYTFRATALTGVKATGLLTSDATAPANGDTITIEGKTYTFKTALSDPAQQNEVLIGTAAASLDYLKQAINQGDTAYPTAPTNEGRGTNWSTGTVRHALVTATTNTNTTQVVEAHEYGTAANQYSLGYTGTHTTWGATKMGTVVTTEVAGVAQVADEIKIQASVALTLDVIKDAINRTSTVAVIGTDYSTKTGVHQQVTATTNSNTQQTVQARNAAFDNASIGTTTSSTGTHYSWGATTLASGVRGVIALNGTTSMGNAGVSGDSNHI